MARGLTTVGLATAAVACVAAGLVLGFVGSIMFSGAAPFTGEPVAGDKFSGVMLIVVGLVVGVLGPVGIGFWVRRQRRDQG